MSKVAHVVVHDVSKMKPKQLEALGLQLFQLNNRAKDGEQDDFALVQGRVSLHEKKYVFVFVSPMGVAYKPLSEIHALTKVIEFVEDVA